MICGDVRVFGCWVCSVRVVLCIVYCRLGICLLLDLVVSILVFVSLLASHDFGSLCLGSFAELLSMNPPFFTRPLGNQLLLSKRIPSIRICSTPIHLISLAQQVQSK